MCAKAKNEDQRISQSIYPSMAGDMRPAVGSWTHQDTANIHVFQIVSCASCTTAVTVSASQANTGEPTFCAMCRQRTLAAQAGIMLPQPPPFLVMGPPMGRPSGQHTRKLVPMAGTPVKQSSLLDEAMAFIHPDHRRAIRARGGAPDPNFPLQSPAPAYFPLVRDANTIAPHYGPRGEILAVLPTSLSQPLATGGHTSTWPLVPLQSGRTRADSIVIPDSSDSPSSAQVYVIVKLQKCAYTHHLFRVRTMGPIW